MTPYEMAKNFARLHLQVAQAEHRNLTGGIIHDSVESACDHPTTRELGADDRAKLVRVLESEYQTVIGAGRELLGADEYLCSEPQP